MHLYNEILDIKAPKGDAPKVIIISGDAGAGKTTILCCTLENWRKDPSVMSNLSSFSIVLYMQFRNHIHDNFDDYLRDLLPQRLSLFDIKLIRDSILSASCLILCDGYDEANDNSEKLFREMLALNCKDMKIVVTTRPGNTERLTQIVNSSKLRRINLSVLGLTNTDMTQLTKRVCSHLLKDDENRRKEMEGEILQAIDKMDERIMAILKTPLYFNLFILLFIECPDLRKDVNSGTTLYIQLKKHMEKRIIEKTNMKKESLKEFEELYRKYSFKTYTKKKYEWTKIDVDQFKSEVQSQEVLENFDYLMSSYFNVKHKMKHLEIEEVFCYGHRSQQEFAVANLICEDIVNTDRSQKGNIIENVLSTNEIQTDFISNFMSIDLLIFIVGILYNSNRDVFQESIRDIYKLVMKENEYRKIKLDPVLALYAETNRDQKSLESLVSILENLGSSRRLVLRADLSISTLPSLLPKLNPRTIQIDRWATRGINTSALAEAVKVASHHNICIGTSVLLRDLTGSCGLASSTADDLWLRIADDELEDLSRLQQFPVAGKKQDVSVYPSLVKKRDIKQLAHLINTIWPRRSISEEAGTETPSQEDEAPIIRLKFWGCKYTYDDIRILLESLDILPLSRVMIHSDIPATEFYLTEERNDNLLQKLCETKGFGKLSFTSSLISRANASNVGWPGGLN